MPSTHAERLAVIKQNYDDAHDNEATDLAKAKNAEEVAAIQANVANARLTYLRAVAGMLSNTSEVVEAAYSAALNASAQVKKARADVEAIAGLVGKLSSATAKAAELLEKAKTKI